MKCLCHVTGWDLWHLPEPVMVDISTFLSLMLVDILLSINKHEHVTGFTDLKTASVHFWMHIVPHQQLKARQFYLFHLFFTNS